MVRASHRNGQVGTLGDIDENGYAEFASDTGARYTVHHLETHAETPTAKERSAALERWAQWPAGTLRFAVEKGKHGALSAFIVARTYSPAPERQLTAGA
jgi:hypothetical protein